MSELEDARKTLKSALEKIDRKELFDKLRSPEQLTETNFSVKMDDGSYKEFKGYRSLHSTIRGPGKGGVRFSPHVNREEVIALSLWMSMKTAIANIPYGGAKGGVIVDTEKISRNEKEKITRAYTRSIAGAIGPNTDVPAPDMNTGSQEMAWMMDEYSNLQGETKPGVVTGKPPEAFGSEGRDKSTGYGAAYIVEKIIEEKDLDPSEVDVAVQGFGNAAAPAVEYLDELGANIVAVSDSSGAVHDSNGFSYEELTDCKRTHGEICPVGEEISNSELLTLDVDFLIPAAIGGVITGENADDVRADHIVEIANGPTTSEADQILHANGVDVVPDVLANTGGVTVSYYEWVQNRIGEYWSEEKVLQKLRDNILSEYSHFRKISGQHDEPNRLSAYRIGARRLANSVDARR